MFQQSRPHAKTANPIIFWKKLGGKSKQIYLIIFKILFFKKKPHRKNDSKEKEVIEEVSKPWGRCKKTTYKKKKKKVSTYIKKLMEKKKKTFLTMMGKYEDRNKGRKYKE
jgi:hypothetical protein